MVSEKNFKITISAYGKFDLFRWAEGFQKNKLLFRLLTDFYSQKTQLLSWRRKDNEMIELDKVKTFLLPRLIRLLKNFTPSYQYYENYLFDWWASRKITGSDLIITRSSCALKTLEVARRCNIKSILYRGSSHIEFQKNITEEEFELWKVQLKENNIIDPRAIDRELQEYRLCDYLYTPSLFAANTYIQRGVSKEKIIHFPLSVERLIDFDDSPISREGLKFQILYVGGISLRKGVQYLLEAVKNIRTQGGHDIELVLIGGLSEEFGPILKRYDGHFTYLGKIPHHNLADYYKRASVFVFPSIDDGFGQVLTEAMCFGLPVITTDHSAGSDIIEDNANGFVVPIRSADALAEKILYLYNNPALRDKMGRNNVEKADALSTDFFINRWIDFLKKVDWLKQ